MKIKPLHCRLILRGLCTVIYVALLFSIGLTAYAETGVPQAVLTATDSVVFIGLGIGSDEFSSTQWLAYKEAYPNHVFQCQDKEYLRQGNGSGFVIKNEDGKILIVTNNHVVDDYYNSVFVWLNRNNVVQAEVVFAVPEKDLSVIRLHGTTDKKPVPLSLEDAQRGDAVYAVGFPGVADVYSDGSALTSDEATITDGIISAVRSLTLVKGESPTKLLQINAAVNPGNSGGPLFDSQGNVIGINTLASNASVSNDNLTIYQNTNGAIAISELWHLLEQYDISIPVSAAAEPIPHETVPAVSLPQKSYALVVISIVTICLVTITILFLFLKKSHKSNHSIKIDNKMFFEKEYPGKHIVDSDILNNPKIEITRSRKYFHPLENLTEDYFKNIKLED